MSYILDALSKSERERRGAAQGHARFDAKLTPVPEPSRRWHLVLALALAGNVMLLGWLLWPRSQPAMSDAPALPAPPPSPVQSGEPTLAQLFNTRPAPAPHTTADTDAQAAAPAPQSSVVETPEPSPSALPPLREELPIELQRQLPPFEINVHVYSEDPAARFVLVNLRRHREGSVLASGLVLEQITPEGLIMRQGQQRFRVLLH